ncbi:MAG: hypothetical protein ACFE0O_06905 [Opitutales bacterium]
MNDAMIARESVFKTVLTVAVAAGIGAAVGFMVGSSGTQERPAPGSTSEATAPTPADQQATGRPAPATQRPVQSPAGGAGAPEPDPGSLFVWAERTEDPETARLMTELAVRLWQRTDPRAAANWVLAQRGREDREALMYAVLVPWFDRDSLAVSRWLNTLPNDPVLDSAIGYLATTAARDDPAAAMSWAASITDPKRRETHQLAVAVQWFRQDPAAARAWLEDADLSAAMKAHLEIFDPGER